MKATAIVFSMFALSIAFTSSADAQSRLYCRSTCGYVYHQGSPNTGKASQTSQVNACYRACMHRTPR